jgi:hypothetical protein
LQPAAEGRSRVEDQSDFDGVPLDQTTVAQELLNIDNKP